MRLGLLLALAFGLVCAAGSAAADLPSAYGIAQQGTLKVVAGVLVTAEGAELKGVWLDDTKGCLAKRTLAVSILVDRVPKPGGATTRVRRSRSGAVDNCAEGGSNFGYDLTARAARMACPDGHWKPGYYSFVTTVRDRTSGLVATASLHYEATRSC
jgi:hypothetical protein